MKKYFNLTVFVLLLILLSNKSYAQPDRFWSVSFNTEASMLAGAVVGDNSDITSIYFNPAGISQIEDQKFVLNANLFKLKYESYEGYMGENTSSEDWGFRVQPRFVSYTYRSKKINKLSYQVAVFNRNSENKSIYAQEKVLSNYYQKEGTEQTISNYDYTSDYNDYWGGLGLSYQFNEKLSVGVSLLASIKTFSYDKNLFVMVLNYENKTIGDSYLFNFESYERIMLYDVRALAKVGVKYKIKQWALGLNITVPSVHVLGNSDVKRKINYVNYENEEGVSESGIANEFSQYRAAKIKDPLSLAFGFVYYSKNLKSQYYFSTEYFHAIETYLVVDGKQSVYADEYPEGTDFSSYKFGTKSITNLAIGYKRILSKNFDIVMGAKTDFNAYLVSNEGVFEGINEMDKVHNNLYHITIGSNFNVKKASFVLGFENSFGQLNNTESLMRVNGFNIIPMDKEGKMDYFTYSIGMFLGFTLDF